MSKVHLIFSDAHAHPDHDNKRAEWLGKLIMDLRPDVLVNLGDLADMPSLSSHDKGTKGFHGRSYKRDVDAALEAGMTAHLAKPLENDKLMDILLQFCGNGDSASLGRSSSSVPV